LRKEDAGYYAGIVTFNTTVATQSHSLAKTTALRQDFDAAPFLLSFDR